MSGGHHRLRVPRWRWLALPVAVTVLAGCSDLGPEEGTGDLDQAIELWASLGIDDYTYAVERQCFCGGDWRGPVRVTVEDGAIVSRSYVDSGEAVPAEIDFPDVEGLFEVLQDAVNRDAHQITVTYDSTTGVPVEFWIDYDQNTVDEELGFRVTESVQPAG